MSIALRLKALVCVAVLGAGLSLFGHGLWIQAKAQLAQWLIESAWEQSQPNASVKPWPWADTWPVAKLSFPQQQKELIALHGLEGNSLAFGPGMVAVKHASTNAMTQVLAGHKDTHFTFLEQTSIGEQFSITDADGRTQYFSITQIEVVDTRKTPALNLAAQQDVVLITCYPFGLAQPGPLRYVVYAESKDKSIKKAGAQLVLHRPNLSY